MLEAGASTSIVVIRASGVARPIVPAVNTPYPTCVSTGAPTAVTGVQNCNISGIMTYKKTTDLSNKIFTDNGKYLIFFQDIQKDMSRDLNNKMIF